MSRVDKGADRADGAFDIADYFEGGIAGMVLLGVTAVLWLLGRKHEKRRAEARE